MSNLTDLVPPLELCKKIPAGEFEDSYFVRVKTFEGWVILLRNCVEKNKAYITGSAVYPAPTLEEVLQSLKTGVLCGIEHHGDMYVSNRHIGCFEDRSGATAALKLWFKLKGIEA